MSKVISTSNAPGPVGPYSQGIKIGNLFFISGQTQSAVGKLVEGDVAAQASRPAKMFLQYLNHRASLPTTWLKPLCLLPTHEYLCSVERNLQILYGSLPRAFVR